MRINKLSLKIAAAAVFAALVITGCLTAKKTYEKDPSLPQYEGVIKVKGLESKVEIYRDKYAIPHIFADNERDLFYGAGWAQAQDRLWNMVFMRAVSQRAGIETAEG